jgi:regulatory protein
VDLALPGRPAGNVAVARTDELERAIERAMKLLTIRARSRRELADRLIGMGFGPLVVDKVDRRLVELGLVDDNEFALQRVRHLLAKGRSTGATRVDLESHGLPTELIESYIQQAGGAPGDLERAVAVARKRLVICRHFPAVKAFQRVVRYLCAQGYEPEVAEEACRRALGDAGPVGADD